jgi:hypothetical protein
MSLAADVYINTPNFLALGRHNQYNQLYSDLGICLAFDLPEIYDI